VRQANAGPGQKLNQVQTGGQGGWRGRDCA